MAYQLVAVDFLPPGILGQQMQQLSCSLSQGKVAPLPQAGYSMSAVVSAMRLLAQASHTGKVRDLAMHGLLLSLLLSIPSQNWQNQPAYRCTGFQHTHTGRRFDRHFSGLLLAGLCCSRCVGTEELMVACLGLLLMSTGGGAVPAAGTTAPCPGQQQVVCGHHRWHRRPGLAHGLLGGIHGGGAHHQADQQDGRPA